MRTLVISCIKGSLKGHRQTYDQSLVRIGRRENCDFSLSEKDGHASGLHAEIERRRNHFFIRDLGSTNGTFVDGKRVSSETQLSEGALVACGTDGPVLKIEFLGEDEDLANATMVAVPGLIADQEGSGKTGYYTALVQEKLHQSSVQMRWVIAALVGAMLVALSVGYWLIDKQDAGETGRLIARDNENRLFMLISKSGNKLTGYCTAFVVGTGGILATNAHCVRAGEELHSKGALLLARMNGNPKHTYTVSRWKIHPDYLESRLSPDVGLLYLELKGATLPNAVNLASEDRFLALEQGQKLYTMGFPGKVMNESDPAADFREATITRLTNFDNKAGDNRETRVIWHNAETSKGTSGSPLFDTEGFVVGLNNGGLTAKKILVRDEVTGELINDIVYEATGHNFGVRVDALITLLNGSQ
jgi:hypothetical protein